MIFIIAVISKNKSNLENYIFNNYFISLCLSLELDFIYNYFKQIIISHITILYNTEKENKLKTKKFSEFSNLDIFLLLAESRKEKLII